MKAARPSVAEIPQHSAADAINRYPRIGCLVGEEFFESVGIKSDHHFFADHQRRCGAALVFVDEVLNSLRILADIAFFVWNAFLRKVALGPRTRWSARLRENNYGFCHVLLEARIPSAEVFYSITISKLISAVFFNIPSTEQYFSIESRTASSTDFWFTGPATRYTSLIFL